MKTMMTVALFFCCQAVFGLLCPQCYQYMLDGDEFCHNCGLKRREVSHEAISPAASESYAPSEYVDHYSSGSHSSLAVGDRLAGMGRGIVTIALSPLNVFRGMVTGLCWTGAVVEGGKISDGQAVMYISILIIPVGTVFSSFSICADAINGTFDITTGGYYGDWLYDSDVSGEPTPWIWDRKWNSSKIPWIDRK